VVSIASPGNTYFEPKTRDLLSSLGTFEGILNVSRQTPGKRLQLGHPCLIPHSSL